ncbi:MAG: flagellar basal body P-ring protein FlgI [Planctomycetota bacterium]
MKQLLTLITAACVLLPAAAAEAGSRTQLRNICRIKGQEENTLRGMGLVVGLNGTGEANDLPTMRALARAMELLGSPVSTTGRLDAASIDALKKTKNVALVMVSATVPATGARRGDQLDCTVSAINGKSLEGGRLAFAALQGPNTQDRRIFALCEGALQIDNPLQPMVGVVHSGCQMQQDVFTPFHQDGFLTLVLDRNHAGFYTADQIAGDIRREYSEFLAEFSRDSNYGEIALQCVRAINASNIVVRIPETYRTDPVGFAGLLFEIEVYETEPEARVTINPRAGTVIISGEVEIGETVVMHRNLVVEATEQVSFASVDQGDQARPKLQRLVQALGDLKVPADDIIEIIRGIERNGKLSGKLIIE